MGSRGCAQRSPEIRWVTRLVHERKVEVRSRHLSHLRPIRLCHDTKPFVPALLAASRSGTLEVDEAAKGEEERGSDAKVDGAGRPVSRCELE